MNITPREITLLAEQAAFVHGVSKDQALGIISMVLDHVGVQVEELSVNPVFAPLLDIMSGKVKA
jgi:hypothetical protein